MSKTPRTDELRNRASKGNLDESDLFDAAEQLETELASVQMELGATKGELSEAKRCSYAKGMRDADLKRIQELAIELQESQAREAQLREALGIAINGLQEWCDDVDRDSSWDGWDSNFKHWKWKGIKELEQALTTK